MAAGVTGGSAFVGVGGMEKRVRKRAISRLKE